MTALQLHRLRTGFNGRLEGAQTLMITVRILVASAIMAAVAWGLWTAIDRVVGRSFSVSSSRSASRSPPRGRCTPGP